MDFLQLHKAVAEANRKYPGYGVAIVVEVEGKLVCLSSIESVVMLGAEVVGLLGIKRHENGVNYRSFQLASDPAGVQRIKEYIRENIEEEPCRTEKIL